MDLLLTYWSSVFLASAHRYDLIQERKMVIQPATLPFCHRVCVTLTSGVKKNYTNAQYVTVVSPPEQIHVYMENPQPNIRVIE